MDSQSRVDRWRQLWSSDLYKNWHLTDRNPDLWKYLHLLCGDENDKSGLFLVPMCGKCVDLKFLYEEGFNVVGVEFCEEVVQVFFEENALTYEIKDHSAELKVYSTADKRLRIVCGDVLAVTKEVLGKEPVKMVWDRGSFGSIAKELRKDYVRVMKALLLGSDVRYLLDIWQYVDWYRTDPPFNCPLEMIEELFGDSLDIQELQRVENNKKSEAMGASTGSKLIYLMTNKTS